MDSLFDESKSLNDKLYEYMSLKAELEGLKKIEDIPEEYLPKNSLQHFCMVKDLVPVISKDLRPYVLPEMGVPVPQNRNGLWSHVKKSGIDSYVNGTIIPKLVDAYGSDPRSVQALGTVYTISYVIDEKTKLYQNKQKQMTQLLIDTGGTFQEVVVWPKYGESLAETGFKGKICRIGWRFNSKRNEMAVGTIEVIDISKYRV
jgi:hypothetical protein